MCLSRGRPKRKCKISGDAIQGWVKVFRAPAFYLIGILPFGLGTLLAVRSGTTMVWGLWLLGTLAVALIMAMTFLVNEYFDFATDSANETFNKFSGGSRALPNDLVPRRYVLLAAGGCAVLAAVVGLIVQFGFKTGPLTLPLGIAAMAVGYAYTGKPFQLIYRGFGELADGLTIAWLPVFIAYYLLAGVPHGAYVHLMTLPIMFSIVMAGLINEYPDYASDKAFRKNNLVARLGPGRAVWLYTALGVGTAASALFLGFTYFSGWQLFVLLVPAALSLTLAAALLAGLWKRPAMLERLCLATILLNLSIIILLMVIVAL